MELNGWSSPQMLTRYGASARSARARCTYDRIMDSSPGREPVRQEGTHSGCCHHCLRRRRVRS